MNEVARHRKSSRGEAGNPILIAAFLLLMVPGCHTMTFELTNAPQERIVRQRKSFFLWGLVPTREVDVSAICPHGVAAIGEETTFLDGLFAALTLGIWSPRSSWYLCMAPPSEGSVR